MMAKLARHASGERYRAKNKEHLKAVQRDWCRKKAVEKLEKKKKLQAL